MNNYDLAKPENRVLLAIPLGAYAIAIAAQEMHWLPDSSLLNLFIGLIRLYIIYVIGRNGTILKTAPYAQIIPLLFGIILIGTLFKTMHWFMANQLLMIGYFGLALLYTVRFILKRSLKLLDVLKFLWVCSLSLGIVFTLLHLPHREVVASVQEVAFWALIFSVYYELVLKPRKQNPGNAADTQ
jgi:hypothetical protein